MSSRLFSWSLTSALAGFLFGFDTVVISGAEKTIQTLWGLSDAMHGMAIASALYGTVLGALLGGWPTDRFGRKTTLLWIGIFYFVSAVGSALAPEVWSFGLARFLGGLAIGVSTVAAPLYISEISPPGRRGQLTALFQFNIVFGILAAFGSNALLARTSEHDWRWMLGVEAFPALLFTILCGVVPESPRWLLAFRGDRERGLASLRLVNEGAAEADLLAQADRLLSSQAAAAATAGPSDFWSRRWRIPVLLAILVAVFNQLSGINAILYFAPRIFELTGLGPKAAMLQSVGIGVTNLIFTFVGLRLIDRLGRRALLLIGSIGYIVSLGLCAWAFFTEHFAIVPPCIFAFIAAHAVGQGAVIWVLISEIFPDRHRASGQALGSFTHWLFAALLTTTFPWMVGQFAPGWIFVFFCGMMVLQLLWVLFMVPETKGVALEDIQAQLERPH